MKLWKGLLTWCRIGPLLALCLLSACAADKDADLGPQGAELVSESQALLADLGYAPGPVDGIPGSRTAAAVRAYQADHGLVVDGGVGKGLLAHLQATRQTRLVMRAQRDLAALGYDPGPIDGREGPETQAAVTAFQTSAGLEPDGQVTEAFGQVLAAAAGKAPAKAVKTAAVPPARHILEPGDRILLRYRGTEEKAAELSVDPDGRLALPEGGNVKAAGLGLKELRDQITVQLIESYVDALKVKVELEDPQGAGESAKESGGKLEPGDRTLVRLAADQKPAEVQVGADGWLTLPGARRIKAAGLELQELEVEITMELLESYMSKLDVSVDLVAPGRAAKTTD